MVKTNPVPKLPASKPFSLPKVPQGRPMSGSQASRSSASGYGKLQKLPGGSPGVMVPKMPRD